jgi:hypothetical protein
MKDGLGSIFGMVGFSTGFALILYFNFISPKEPSTPKETPTKTPIESRPPAGLDRHDCQKIVRAIHQYTSAEVVRHSPNRENIFMKHSDSGTEIVVMCARYVTHPSVYISYDGAIPSKEWYDIVYKSAYAAASSDFEAIKRTVNDCIKHAFFEKFEHFYIKAKGLDVSCQAFKSRGGGVSVDVSDYDGDPERQDDP